MNEMNQLNGIEIEDWHCLLMVANINGIAGKTKDIIYSSGISEKKVGLDCEAITIAASYLKNWLSAMFLDEKASPERRIAHHSALIVSYI
jgi:hypothetical protein